MIPKNKGLLESPHDSRDYALSSISPVLMRYPEICPPPFDLTVKNQGARPSCVANSSSAMKQEKELRQRIPVELDAEGFYDECKIADGMPQIQGTYFRVAMKLLKDTGIKSLNDNTRFKISSYALIDDLSFEGLKKVIFLYGAVIVGYRGSDEGWKGEYVRPPKEGENVWQHAVTLVGYEKDYLIGQNSWGNNWGNQGMFKVGKNYFPFEGWAVMVDAVADFKPIQTGWVATKYLLLTNGVWKTTTNLNVRSGAGTTFSILKTLAKDSVVQIVNEPTVPANSYVWQKIIM